MKLSSIMPISNESVERLYSSLPFIKSNLFINQILAKLIFRLNTCKKLLKNEFAADKFPLLLRNQNEL